MHIPDLQIVVVLCGLTVGFIVGMTGIGGGSLMTPILIYLGFPPTTAVGTDLLYATVTKGGGVFVHQKKKNIDWRITGLLAVGSLPAALATLLLLRSIGLGGNNADTFIRVALGITIMVTAFAIIARDKLLALSRQHDWYFTRMSEPHRERATVVVGILMGVLVTATSIGAGVLGTVMLFLIYPKLPVAKLVGTEIAHAVPLTLIAGLGHATAGHVNWDLLTNLLLGSLPGIYIGSHMPSAIPEKVLRPVLASMMILVGAKLLVF